MATNLGEPVGWPLVLGEEHNTLGCFKTGNYNSFYCTKDLVYLFQDCCVQGTL